MKCDFIIHDFINLQLHMYVYDLLQITSDCHVTVRQLVWQMARTQSSLYAEERYNLSPASWKSKVQVSLHS